jgi:penicillin-binding protein 1A
MSLYTVAVRLGVEVTPKIVVQVATRLGITSTLQPNASIALGTSETTLLEMTRAYVPFANGGDGVLPYVIKAIRTSDGQVLFARKGDGPGRVVRGDHVAQMNYMLAHAVAVGTARKAHIPGWAVAGKTGTSQDFRDAWFIGYTAHLVGGVWLGNDDGTPTKKATGSGLPTQVWSKFMTAAHKGMRPIALPGAGDALPAPDPGAATIDDILMGRFTPEPARRGSGARNSPQPVDVEGRSPSQPVEVGNCPLDSNFMQCVFGGR